MIMSRVVIDFTWVERFAIGICRDQHTPQVVFGISTSRSVGLTTKLGSTTIVQVADLGCT